MNTQLDNLTIADLQQRYNLKSKQTVYNRMNEVNIKPKNGRVDANQLALLDEIDHRIQAGETLKEIGASLRSSPSSQPNGLALESSTVHPVQSSPSSLVDGYQISIVQLLQAVEMVVNGLKRPHPLQVHRDLQEAADRNALLSTSQIRAILGQRPKEGMMYGYTIRKDGRSGKGSELGWRIFKP